MYVDPDFIPASVAISTDPHTVEELYVTQWRPAAQTLPGAPLFVEDAAQPDLLCNQDIDDCWLADAFAMVAMRPELLLHVFASTGSIDRGVITLRLFKHGAWVPVTIDTMLPCRADGSAAFCCAGEGEALWPSLLVKAMAKLHGSYASLSGGEVRCEPRCVRRSTRVPI
jgi:hypothetical protein